MARFRRINGALVDTFTGEVLRKPKLNRGLKFTRKKSIKRHKGFGTSGLRGWANHLLPKDKRKAIPAELKKPVLKYPKKPVNKPTKRRYDLEKRKLQAKKAKILDWLFKDKPKREKAAETAYNATKKTISGARSAGSWLRRAVAESNKNRKDRLPEKEFKRRRKALKSTGRFIYRKTIGSVRWF